MVAARGHAPAGIGVASGMNFPDALTGGAFAANANEPLLLTDPKTLPGVTGDFLQANAAMFQAVTIFGGPGAVSQGVENSIAARMNARIIS